MHKNKTLICENSRLTIVDNLDTMVEILQGGKYFVNEYGSVLFAFTIGEEMQSEDGFRIAAAHGDFPGLRIKPNPEIRSENYVIFYMHFMNYNKNKQYDCFTGGRNEH